AGRQTVAGAGGVGRAGVVGVPTIRPVAARVAARGERRDQDEPLHGRSHAVSCANGNPDVAIAAPPLIVRSPDEPPLSLLPSAAEIDFAGSAKVAATAWPCVRSS